MRKASSFFNQLTLFKSQKSDESDGDSSLHKQYSSSSKCSNDKKSVMEKEWSKTCGQMDKRAQLLQVIANFIFYFIIKLWQDALSEAEKSNTKIKPVNIFKADSSLCLRKPSLYPSSKDDDTTWDTALHSTSFFCINDLPGFGSNKELESIRRDSLTTDDPKSFKRKSKRKQLFKVNSVDDAIFK